MRLVTPVEVGVLPMRDHREREALSPARIDMRYVLGGYRVAQRRSDIPEPEAVEPGDHQGALFWAPGPATDPLDHRGGKRATGSWWWGPPAAYIQDDDRVRPIQSRNLLRDLRYEALRIVRQLPVPRLLQTDTDTRIAVLLPGGLSTTLGAELPAGYPGIVTTGSEEHTAELLFVPAGGFLVSHWRNKPNRYSTLVHDIDKGDKLALLHAARLDTAWRVTLVPEEPGSVSATPPARALAWVGTASPEHDLAGKGMVVHREVTFNPPKAPPPRTPGADGSLDPLDPRAGTGLYDPGARPGSLWAYGTIRGRFFDDRKPGPGAGSKPPPAVLALGPLVNAYASLEGGGPFTAGGPKCQHRFGPNREGEHFAPEHLQAAALWWAGDAMEGPLGFELRPWPGASEFPENSLVHLVHDKALDHPWAEGDLRKLRVGKGVWRWYAEVPWQPCKPPGRPPVPPIPPPKEPPPTPPPEPPITRIPPEPPTMRIPIPLEPDTQIQELRLPEPPAIRLPTVPEEPPAIRLPTVPETTTPPSDGSVVPAIHVRPVETVQEIGLPALVFRPENPWEPGGDLRYQRHVSRAQREQRERAPAVGRFEAFGRALPGCRWEYGGTEALARYEYREGPGGVAFLPPERGVEDVRGEVTVGSQRAPSETYLAFVGTRLGLGCNGLDTETGRPVDGWYAFRDGAVLQWARVDAAGQAVDVAQFLAAGPVRFQVATEHPQRTATASTTLGDLDHTLLVNAAGGPAAVRLVNLPQASAAPGRVYQVKKIAGGGAARAARLTAFAGDQVEGAATLDLVSVGERVTVKSDGGNNWWVMAN